MSSSVFSTVYDANGTGSPVNIGVWSYFVVVSLPSATLYRPSGVGSSSGLFMSQTNDFQTPYNFVTLGGVNSISMASLFGDDGTGVADNVFLWSTRTRVMLSGPSAMKSGKVYLGTLPLSSLMIDATSQITLGSFTVAQLVQNSHTIVDLSTSEHTEFELQNFMMNTNLPFSIYNSSSTTFTNQFQGEIVQFAVVEAAYRNITTGGLSAYTISTETRANMAYFPKASSVIAQALSGSRNIEEKQIPAKDVSEQAYIRKLQQDLRDRRQSNVTDKAPNPTVQAPKWLYKLSPSLSKGWDWLEDAYEKVKPWAHTALKIGEMIAPLLMVENDLADTATYRQYLTSSVHQLKALAVYQTHVDVLQKDVQWLATQDRLFQRSQLPSQKQVTVKALPQTNQNYHPQEHRVTIHSQQQPQPPPYTYVVAQNDQRWADVEKNPGPCVLQDVDDDPA